MCIVSYLIFLVEFSLVLMFEIERINSLYRRDTYSFTTYLDAFFIL